MRDGDKKHLFLSRGITFYTSETSVMVNGKIIKLDIPEDADISDLLNDQLVLSLKSNWVVNACTH